MRVCEDDDGELAAGCDLRWPSCSSSRARVQVKVKVRVRVKIKLKFRVRVKVQVQVLKVKVKVRVQVRVQVRVRVRLGQHPPIMAGSERGKTISLHSGFEQRRQWPADCKGAGLPHLAQ